jgi:hypothetical protein
MNPAKTQVVKYYGLNGLRFWKLYALKPDPQCDGIREENLGR